MPASQTSPAEGVNAAMPGVARLFHVVTSAVLVAFVIWGFHHFYLQGRAYPGRDLAPPIRALVIAHGVVMALWMILMVVQPLLIVAGRRRVHMALGKAGAVVAILIVILGLRLGVEAIRITPPEAVIWGLSPKQFMAVPIISILAFGGLAAAGILNRRRPHVHRTMMLLATLAAVPAGISRIDAISALYSDTIWSLVFGPFFATLVFALIFLGVKCALTRSFDRWLAGGCAGLTLLSAGIMGLARTPLWDSIAGFLLG